SKLKVQSSKFKVQNRKSQTRTTFMEYWRRIDIDQYDPDSQYIPDDLPESKPNTSLSDIQALTQTLRASIQRMSISEAFNTAIEYAPYGANEDVRVAYLKSIFEIFISVKTNDIPTIIKQLSLDNLDIIVKFLYTLMSKDWAMKQSGLLLVWLDKIVEQVGEGPIIRYMSDPYKL
ncbi:hypothetical protein C6P42_002862, partial [Pichia californica]